MTNKTNHETLPQAVDNLIEKVCKIESMLLNNVKSVEPISRNLNFNNARNYIKGKGIPMSSSKLYKMTSSKDCTIPFHKTGRMLLFYSHELDEWCKGQITMPFTANANSELSIVKSAQLKLYRYGS